MSRCFLIGPSLSLIDEVARNLYANGSDFSGNIVVFPGKRPAHFLRKHLATQLGRSFIPPRTFSIDGFVDDVYREKLGLQDKDVDPIDAVAILHRLHLDLPERIGGRSFENLESFLPVGLRLFHELEELGMANIPRTTIKQQLATLTSGNAHLLGTLFERFYDEIGRQSRCTRSSKYRVVADRFGDIDWSSFSTIMFGGFFALTTLEKSIFSQCRELPNAVFFFQEGKGLKRHLDALGMTPKKTAGVNNEPIIRFHRNSDTHGQMFVLGDILRRANDEGQPIDERTAVVLPAAENLFALLHQSLAQFGDDQYNISLGYPITRTPVYGFLHRLMELVSSEHQGKLYAPEYVNFLLHPYTKNIRLGRRADITRIAVHVIEEYFSEEASRAFFTLEELEGNKRLFERMLRRVSGTGDGLTAGKLQSHMKSIHDRTIRPVQSFENIGDCALKCIQVLEYVYGHSTAQLHPLFRPFAEALIETLEHISTSLLRAERFDTAAAYFTFLRHSIATGMIPFLGTPVQGLQVLGFLETRTLKFDTVYLLDVNDEILPGSSPQDTLLPQKVREALGLPTYHDREEVAAYYFDVLLKGAKRVHLFFTENGRTMKSRFVEQLLWDREKAAAFQRKGELALNDGRQIQSTRYAVHLGNTVPGEIPKSPEVVGYLKRFTFTASAVDAYLKCPLKFYYAYVLRLEEKQAVTDDVERSDLGILVHRILARLFRDEAGNVISKGTGDVEKLDRIVEEEFAQFYGAENTGRKYLLKSQIRKQLHRFLTKYHQPLYKDDQVMLIGLERKLVAEQGPHAIKGILDRIETRTGRTFILDYKTGSNDIRLRINFKKLVDDDPATWRGAIGSLQLPFYMLLYSSARGEPIENISPAYLLLGKNTVNDKIEVRLFDEADAVTEKYLRLERIIVSLLNEIINADQPFRPTDDLEQYCPECPFQALCGTQWVEERRW